MAKRRTTITYVDQQTGRTHRVDAEIAPGATRAQVARRLERINNMPAGRVKITRGI